MGFMFPANGKLGRFGNSAAWWLGIQPYELFFYVFLPPLLLDAAVRIDFFLFKKVWSKNRAGRPGYAPCRRRRGAPGRCHGWRSCAVAAGWHGTSPVVSGNVHRVRAALCLVAARRACFSHAAFAT